MLNLIEELMLSMTVTEDSSQGGVLFCYAPNPNSVIPYMESYRNKTCLQLRFVSAKTESCLPPYIVRGSHKLDCEIERDPPDP